MTPTQPRDATRPASSVSSVSRRVLRDDVYDALLEILLEGEIGPGEPLSIEALARRLGVSPTPVREAMGQLEHTGLVTRTALKGYRVADPLSAAQMSELVDARTVLEVAAVRHVVPASAGTLRQLRSVHESHVAAGARFQQSQRRSTKPAWSDVRGYFTADWEFHLTILRNCGNRYLLQMAEHLSPQVHRLRQSISHGPSDAQPAVSEHALILDAIASGDVDRAAAAMQLHLSSVRSRWVAET